MRSAVATGGGSSFRLENPPAWPAMARTADSTAFKR